MAFPAPQGASCQQDSVENDWLSESKRSGLEALLLTSCVTLADISDLLRLPDLKNRVTICDPYKMWENSKIKATELSSSNQH